MPKERILKRSLDQRISLIGKYLNRPPHAYERYETGRLALDKDHRPIPCPGAIYLERASYGYNVAEMTDKPGVSNYLNGNRSLSSRECYHFLEGMLYVLEHKEKLFNGT